MDEFSDHRAIGQVREHYQQQAREAAYAAEKHRAASIGAAGIGFAAQGLAGQQQIEGRDISEVDLQLNQLRGQLEMLAGMTEKLHDRLAPVMRDTGVQKNASEPRVAEQGCTAPLAVIVYDLRQHATRTAEMLASIHRRLAI